MPRRGRNRPAWLWDEERDRLFQDSAGYPIKLGDIIQGGNTGKNYTVVMREGRVKTLRVWDKKPGSEGVIREGRLAADLRKTRMTEYRAFKEEEDRKKRVKALENIKAYKESQNMKKAARKVPAPRRTNPFRGSYVNTANSTI